MQCSHHLTRAPPFSFEKCKDINIPAWYSGYIARYRPTLSDPLAMLQQARSLQVEYFDDFDVEADRQALVLSEFDGVIQRFRDSLMDHFDF
jgi:hypothetical protein